MWVGTGPCYGAVLQTLVGVIMREVSFGALLLDALGHVRFSGFAWGFLDLISAGMRHLHDSAHSMFLKRCLKGAKC